MGSRPRLIWSAAVVTVAVALAGCAPPKFRYVTNRATHTYLKVPRAWTKFEESDLIDAESKAAADSGSTAPSDIDKAVARAVQWRVAFDADRKPSLQHVIGLSKDPVVDVRVRRLLSDERDGVSLSTLRNLVVDYDALKQDASSGGSDTGFRALREDELSPGHGLRGVRLVFQLRDVDGKPYIIDQTALLDASLNHIYLLVVQAGERQFLDHQKLLDEISSSFTVTDKT